MNMSLTNPPTARFNRDTGEVEYLDPVSEGVLGSYPGCQETVKGVIVQILVPHQLAGRAAAYGIPIATHAKVGAIRRLRDAVAKHEEAADQPGALPAVRSEEATFARQSLGAEIHARRVELGMSRKMLCASTRRYADAMGRNWHHGWSSSSVQAWERGAAAPPHIEPVVRALVPDERTEIRWRRWWTTCRVGLSAEERRLALEVLADREAELGEDEAPVEPTEDAVGKLQRTLEEAAKRDAAYEDI